MYGGTKTEMQRLLADATKLSGVEYDISNLGDVYDAIHVIQEDLGLTGVAAAEAEGTFTGSMGAMKASAENLLANLALGNSIEADLQALMGNAEAFIMKNLVPMVSNILNALPELLSGVGSMLIQALNLVSNNSGAIVQQGIDIVVSLVKAIVQAAPYLVEAAVNLVAELGKALLTTDWVAVGTDLINSLKESMALASGEIFGSDTSIIDSVLNSITSGLPSLLDKGIEIISNLVNGILSSLPSLITTAGQLITTFASFLMQNFPTIMQKGAELILNLVNGIISNLPQIAASVVQVIGSFAATILSNLPTILAQGILIIGKLAAGLIQAIPKVVLAIPQIIKTIIDTFSAFDWASIGKNILEGIKNGILGAVSAVVDAAKEAASAVWDAIKGFFDIGSPSKLMAYAGEMIDTGLANGIVGNQSLVDKAVDSLNSEAMGAFGVSANFGEIETRQDDRIDELLDLLGNYLPTIASGENMNVSITGDAEGIFNLVKSQNKIYKRMNGESAFA